VLSRQIAGIGIYPAANPLDSTSRVIGTEHERAKAHQARPQATAADVAPAARSDPAQWRRP